MAYVKIKPVRNHLEALLAYACNKEKTVNIDFNDLKDLIEYTEDDLKTEQKLFVDGINCEPENALEMMHAAYLKNDKAMPILAYHAIQSFAEGEVDARTAHEIGIKLAQELWGNFHVIVATHLNTNHYHNHFVICSTSFIDGARYNDNKAGKQRMRDASDRLCMEYGLSVIENPGQHSGKNYAQWRDEKEGLPTLISKIKDDVDLAIHDSHSWKMFLWHMRSMGYTVNVRGSEEDPLLSVTPPGYKHPWRLSRHFGDEYSFNGVIEQIRENDDYDKYIDQHNDVRLKGGVQNFTKVRTLHELYLHLLFELRVFPQQKDERIPPELYADIRKLDSITDQTRFLGQKHIDTAGQLDAYRSADEEQLNDLIAVRQKLRNKLRRETDEDTISGIKDEITGLSKQISALRKEIGLCESIAGRSEDYREKLASIYEREGLLQNA